MLFGIVSNAQEKTALKDYFVPIPKEVIISSGNFIPNKGRIIAYKISKNNNVRLAARQLQNLLKEKGMHFSIAGNKAKGENPEIELILDAKKVKNIQGYFIDVSERNIKIIGHDAAGLYYGVLTLGQMAHYAYDHGNFPQVQVSDHPDFKRRGVTMDISRCKVPTMESLYQYIDMFASWKINEIQLYTEHTFEYQNHKKVWQDDGALSADNILALDKYCADKFIDLVPNQNGFGHMQRWLEHKEYWNIAENEEVKDPSHPLLGFRKTLSAVDEESVRFVGGLYSELLPNFSSDYINIGGDEPYELGTGKSKEAVDKKGKGQVYLDFLLKLNDEVVKNGKKAQFWGDIILHYPDLIKKLPKNITCMVWGYRASHPFDKQASKFKKAKIPFYVCPGTSSWRSITGRVENAILNQVNAAKNGLKYDAIGYLNTDWGDKGHHQHLISSYAPYVYGAAVSWSLKVNETLDINSVLNRYIYKDPANKTSQIIYDMGNVNQLTDPSNVFNSTFFSLLKYCNQPMSAQRHLKKLTVVNLTKTKNALYHIIARVSESKATSTDASIIHREIESAARLAIHACNLGIAKLNTSDGTIMSVDVDTKYQLAIEMDAIIAEHREVWILRNKVGGLSKSVDYLLETRKFYEE